MKKRIGTEVEWNGRRGERKHHRRKGGDNGPIGWKSNRALLGQKPSAVEPEPHSFWVPETRQAKLLLAFLYINLYVST